MTTRQPSLLIAPPAAVLAKAARARTTGAAPMADFEDELEFFVDEVEVKPCSSRRRAAPQTAPASPNVSPLTEKELTQSRQIALLERNRRGTHFPENATPSDHVRFLHHDPMVHTGKRPFHYGVRRLGNEEQINESVFNGHVVRKLNSHNSLDEINGLRGESDVYVTQADFVWGKKSDPNSHRCSRPYIGGISVMFIDVDLYAETSLVKNLPKEQAISQIQDTLRDNGIPAPVIIDSGRGVYLYWALGERLAFRTKKGSERLQLWQHVQSRLMHLLLPFGADPKVRDLTRVLRLVGSTNPKSGTRVRVISDDGKYHSLATLDACTQKLPAPKWEGKLIPLATPNPMESIDPLGIKEQLASVPAASNWLASEQAIAKFHRFTDMLDKQFKLKNITSKNSLAWRYYRQFADMAKLAVLRGGVPCGYRNDFVFWMTALLYNARLIVPDDVARISAQLAGICEDEFNTFNAGGLNSLMQRMRADEAQRLRNSNSVESRSQGLCPNGIIRITVTSAPRRNLSKVEFDALLPSEQYAQGSYQGWGKSVYTPSVRFLIEHFGITGTEQESMTILIDPVERARRRTLKESNQPARDARDIAIRQSRTAGTSVERIMQEFRVSRATVYRSLVRGAKLLIEAANAKEREQIERRARLEAERLQVRDFYRSVKKRNLPERAAKRTIKANHFFGELSSPSESSGEGDSSHLSESGSCFACSSHKVGVPNKRKTESLLSVDSKGHIPSPRIQAFTPDYSSRIRKKFFQQLNWHENPALYSPLPSKAEKRRLEFSQSNVARAISPPQILKDQAHKRAAANSLKGSSPIAAPSVLRHALALNANAPNVSGALLIAPPKKQLIAPPAKLKEQQRLAARTARAQRHDTARNKTKKGKSTAKTYKNKPAAKMTFADIERNMNELLTKRNQSDAYGIESKSLLAHMVLTNELLESFSAVSVALTELIMAAQKDSTQYKVTQLALDKAKELLSNQMVKEKRALNRHINHCKAFSPTHYRVDSLVTRLVGLCSAQAELLNGLRKDYPVESDKAIARRQRQLDRALSHFFDHSAGQPLSTHFDVWSLDKEGSRLARLVQKDVNELQALRDNLDRYAEQKELEELELSA